MNILAQPGRFLCCFLPLVAIGAFGCRDIEPPPAHNRDLGAEGAPLMPTGSAWRDRAIAEGTADWVPFRAPAIDEGLSAEETATEETPEGESPVEAEIRQLVDDYNDVVSDGAVDDLLEFYVEEQHEAIEPLLEASITLTEKLNQLREALEGRLPEAKARIAEAYTALEAAHTARLPLKSVTVISETEATGDVTWFAEPKTCRFVAVEDEDGEYMWFIELQAPPAYAETKPGIDALTATFEDLLQALQSGQKPAEQVLEGLGQLASQRVPGDMAEPADTGPDADGEEP